MGKTAEVRNVVVVVVVDDDAVVALSVVLVDLIVVVASFATARLKYNFGPLYSRLLCKVFVETFYVCTELVSALN